MGGGIAAAYPNAWHLQGYVSAVASKEMLKIINNNTFQWDGVALRLMGSISWSSFDVIKVNINTLSRFPRFALLAKLHGLSTETQH